MVKMLGVGQLVGKMAEGWLVRVHWQVGEVTEGQHVRSGSAGWRDLVHVAACCMFIWQA